MGKTGNFKSTSDGSAAMSDTSAEVLAGDAARKFLLLQNTGANSVYIRFGGTPTAAATGGILIAAGEVLILDEYVANQAVNGICASSETSTIFYVKA